MQILVKICGRDQHVLNGYFQKHGLGAVLFSVQRPCQRASVSTVPSLHVCVSCRDDTGRHRRVA